MVQGLIDFLVNTLGLSRDFVENRIYDFIGAARFLFWFSLIVPFFLVIIGAEINSEILWAVSGYLALISLVYGVVVLNGPSWAILLIFPATSEEAAIAMKK